MPRELGCDVQRRRRLSGEIGEHRLAVLKSGVAVGLAKYGLRTWLMKTWVEHELTTVLGDGRRVGRPTGDHLGKTQHIVLGVTRAHAQRMQLKDLAPEILVEAAVTVDPGNGA